MISIHLRRSGAKRDPHWRVVVSDSRAARDGAFIEILGHYHPRSEPARVALDVDRVKEWIARGAQPSDTVRSLLKKVELGKVDVVTEALPGAATPEASAEGGEVAAEPEAAGGAGTEPEAEPGDSGTQTEAADDPAGGAEAKGAADTGAKAGAKEADAAEQGAGQPEKEEEVEERD